MKKILWVSAWILAAYLIGCGTGTHIYRPSQFASRGEWLRFCNHYFLGRPDLCQED